MTPTGPGLLAVLLQASLAVALIAVGSWGRREAPRLAPQFLSAEEREAREVVYRRGSLACLVLGWVLAGTVAWVAVVNLG